MDLEGNHNLINAAKDTGVKRFIFVSALGASPDHPVPFLAAKGQTDVNLKESGLEYTILAPTAYMEVWPAMVVGLPVALGNPVTLMGEGRSRQSFISARDVASYAVAAVDNPAAANQYLAIGGPEALSYRDVVAIYERVLGRSIPVNYVGHGEPVPGLPPSMSAMLAGMDFDILLDSSETARKFGVQQTTLEEVVRSMLAVGAA